MLACLGLKNAVVSVTFKSNAGCAHGAACILTRSALLGLLLSAQVCCPVSSTPFLHNGLVVYTAGLDPLMAELIEKRVEGALQIS